MEYSSSEMEMFQKLEISEVMRNKQDLLVRVIDRAIRLVSNLA